MSHYRRSQAHNRFSHIFEKYEKPDTLNGFLVKYEDYYHPGSIDVYIPHAKFPIYVNVQDTRYKMGDTFARMQHFNKVVIQTKYTI